MSRRDGYLLDPSDTIPIKVIPQPRAPERAAPSGGDGPQEPPRRSGAVAAAVFVPALVALGLGMFRLADAPVRQEESAAWWAARLTWGELGRLLNTTDVGFAPYYALLKLWVLVLGDSPAALRLPSVLAVAVTAGLLVLLGRRLADTPTGLVAGLLYAVLPATTRTAQDAQPWGLAALVTVATALLLYRALDHEGSDRWGGYTLGVLVTGLVQLVASAVVAAHLLIVRATDRQRAGAWGAVTMVPFFVLAGVAMLAAGQPAHRATGRPSPGELRELPAVVFGSDQVAVALGVLALLGLVLGRLPGVGLAVWALLPPALTYALTPRIDLFEPASFVFLLPATALLAALGVCRLGRLLPGRGDGRTRRQYTVGLVAAVAVGAVGLRLFPGLYAVPQDGRPDLRAAVAYVEKLREPGDGFVYGGDQAAVMPAAAYQLRRHSPWNAFVAVSPQRDGTYTGEACTAPVVCAKGAERIWLLSTAPAADPYAGMADVQWKYLRSAFVPQRSREFPGGLRVTLYSTKAGR
ncbi:hypothetical protein SRB5_34810 [Streptomyces sp. RB5]|uniref:Glycosyltransferase RgtA/B/C/D-like domain-containing protein n=1 Tax=Streptomyces smaragdinus TaxID=2585196 RepID=A0A7K0CIR4_9ACTN|nr:glycosyltransferase family 39 protein [Streptomyces smaragdinus]MQY13336.1 hypothetical protein [Streptomyces smaragdinus]